jgi:nicotinate-nucleotide adenylyltransferase
MIPRLPPHVRGMNIGLFGGSFDPPHEGHLLVSRVALRRLGLDRLWWLVSPGNPLKGGAAHRPFAARLSASQALARDPRIEVTGIEAEIGARYTVQTLRYLRQRSGGARFVWIMGADNLMNFHRWKNWREIAGSVPIAVIDRPGATLKALSSPAAQALASRRVREEESRGLARRKAPAIVYLHGPRDASSSTAMRAADAPFDAQEPAKKRGFMDWLLGR